MQMNMEAHIKYKCWIWLAVIWSACMVMIGYSAAFTHDEHVEGTVMRYWESRLHGARMPRSVYAMMSPLSSREAAQFLIKIDAVPVTGQYLPRHAAAFCKVARIHCGIQGRSQYVRTEATPNNITMGYRSSPNNITMGYGSSPNNITMGYGNPNNITMGYGSPNNITMGYGSSPNNITMGYSSPNNITMGYGSSPNNITMGYSSSPNNITIAYGSIPTSQITPPHRHHFEDTQPTLLLTSPDHHVHEISGAFFREQQVLVNGVDIYINLAYDGTSSCSDIMDDRAFLPRKLAKLFPLVGQGPAKIASMLGVSHEELQETVELCKARKEDSMMHAEVKMCLASMEDLADFVRAVMGASTEGDIDIDIYDAVDADASHVEVLCKGGQRFHVEEVKVVKAEEPEEAAVACHDMAFPFRVFYCHYIKQTKMVQATLRGEDGSVHKRIAVCHYDTSYWNPKHRAFAELQTKPGQSEACHWLGGTWFQRSGWVFARKVATVAATM